ncbi:MAG TPA: hypothetical protein VG815_12610 [Chloroflexota bacterium]|jgi:hypothetical protein|nr:hypothetical protein [Chloroflexota bacterium]
MTDETADRRLFLLGGIVDTFAAIELRAQVLLAGFALQEIVGEIMAADLGFQAIAQKLRLLSKLPGLERAGEELNEWAKRAAAASERRNAVVHSLWYLHDPDDSDSGTRFKLSTRGKPTAVQDVFRIKPETTGELEDLLGEMNALAVEAEGLAEALRKTGKWMGARIS